MSDPQLQFARESDLKAVLRVFLLSRGVYFFSPMSYGYGRAGVPDIIGCYKGRFFAMEAKTIKGAMSAAQTRELELIHKAGGVAGVVRCIADAEELLRVIDV